MFRLFSAVVCAAMLWPLSTSAATDVPPGQITGNAIWTATGSPYILTGDVTVPAGVTLTLEAGAVVQAKKGDALTSGDVTTRTELIVLGTLLTNGTASSPVVFDSGEVAPATGDWHGIVVQAGGTATLDGADIRSASRGVHVKGSASLSASKVQRCSTGVWVEAAGTATLNEVEIASGGRGLYLLGGGSYTKLWVHDNSAVGVDISNTSLTLSTSLIHDNMNHGVQVTKSSSTASTVQLIHNTIAYNGGSGVYSTRLGSGTLTLDVTNCILAHNTGYGAEEYQYGSTVTDRINNSLVWGNVLGSYGNGASAGTGTFSENPLFVDKAARNLRIGSRSPARQHATGGADIGALPWAGDLTPFLAGHLHEDLTLGAAGSPHEVPGDLTVEPGVTLTVQPGATVRFAANSDLMGGNANPKRTELRVLGSLQAAGTSADKARFEASAKGAEGWWGIDLAAGSGPSKLEHLVVNDASAGVRSAAEATTTLQHSLLEGNTYGVRVVGGSLSMSDLVLKDNTTGLQVDDAAPTLRDSLVYDNESHGIYVAKSSSTASTVQLIHNTIAYNGGSGVYSTRSGAGTLTLNVTDCILAHNTGYGAEEYQYGSTVTDRITNSLVWGNGLGSYGNGASAGTGTFGENPLFVDGPARNLKITSRSPARKHATGGTDIGALPWAGDLTPVLAGHLYEDLTLDAAGSPHLVPGDLTVEPGVTLTVQPGATVRFAAGSDSMGGNAQIAKAELRVLGALQAVGTPANPARFESSTKGAGGWWGIALAAGSGPSNLDHVVVNDALYGVRSAAASTSTLQRSLFEGNTHGVSVEGGSLSMTGLTLKANATGLYVSNASPTLRDSLVYDNTGHGLEVTSSASTGSTVELIHNTIAYNGGSGLYSSRSGSGTLTLNVTDCILAHNASYGAEEYQYGSTVTDRITNSLVWGNALGSYGNGASAGTGTFGENPLFVDGPARDLKITSRSPARKHATGGADIGALPWAGDLTPVLAGHLYENLTLGAAGSPHLVPGDLTVEPGVVLTLLPTARLHFAANSDLMGANADIDRTELRVLGTLNADGAQGFPVTLQASTAGPRAWYGVELLPGSSGSIIDSTVIRDASAGLRISGGAVSVTQTTVELCEAGVRVTGGNPTLTGLIARNNSTDGISFESAGGTVAESILSDNGNNGVTVRNSSTAGPTVSITGCTVVGNQNNGLFMSRLSGTLRVHVSDTIVAHNLNYGIQEDSYYSGVTESITNSLVWGNKAGHYYGVTAGAGTFSENPLFVDLTGRDLRITENSPARQHGTAGRDMGAFAWTGAPTLGLQGHLYSDTTWAAGVHDVLGDITIEPGVTLTIQGGADVRFAAGKDSMGGNRVADRTELRALGTLIVAGSPAARVQLRSSASAPARGDWHGVWLAPTSGASTIEHALIEYATRGVTSEAPAPARLTTTEVRESQSNGVYITSQSSALFQGVVSHHNGGAGFLVEDATPRLESVVAHQNGGDGVRVTNGSATSARTIELLHASLAENAGSGLHVARLGSGTLTVYLKSSISAHNAYGVYHDNYSRTATLGLTYSNLFGNQNSNCQACTPGTGSLSANPMFVDLAGHNYRLQPTSPCVNTGDPASPVTVDAAGALRPLGGRVDMGAYEFNPNANRWPVADAGPDRTVLAGAPVSFDGYASSDPDGTITTYAWDFGDGTTAEGIVVSHTYPAGDGTDRVVTLTVTDNEGATATDTVNVKVNLAPTANAGLDKYEAVNVPITFVGTASKDPDGSLTGYAWDFGDGTTGTGATVSHAYTKGGDFTVTLTVTDNDGATASASIVVHILGGADENAPSITHTPIANGRPEGQALTVTAQVTDATGVGAVSLYYRAESGATFTRLAMVKGTGDSYSATLPAAALVPPAVVYYLEATDTAPTPNTGTSPAGAPASTHRFTVADQTPPVIAHTPIANGQPEGLAVTVRATVTDASGLAGVTLSWRATGAAGYATTAMARGTGDLWSAQIPAAAVTAAGVDYFVTATDAATPANTATAPAAGASAPHRFSVTGSDTAPPTIVHVKIADGQTAGTALNVSATITDDQSVGSATLYYRITGGPVFTAAAMTRGSGDTFTATIPAASVTEAGVDYYLAAVDTASSPNQATHPANAPAAFHAVAINPANSVQPGDLIVSEIMSNPSGTETYREWFEVHNTTGAPIDLQGLQIADDGTDKFTVTTSVVVPARGYVALGRSADPAINGGAAIGYVYSGMTLANTEDEVIIKNGEVVIDRVAWVAGFPTGDGKAMSLDPGALDATANDLAANWCAARTAMSGGDLGTPGAANPSCGAPDTLPPTIAHAAVPNGQPVGVAVTITATVTDASGVASVRLSYRATGAASFTEAAMARGTGDDWSAQIPAATVTSAGVDYFVTASDLATPANTATSPAAGANAPYRFSVTATDTTPPSIAHDKIADGQPAGVSLRITATITDDGTIGSATLHYRSAGAGLFAQAAMTRGTGDDWSAEIPAAAVTTAGVDYYLAATDSASNQATHPANAPASFHSVTVSAAATLAPGDLIISELIANPTGTDTDREWFEVHNTTSAPIDLQGLQFVDGGSDKFTVASSVVVPAGGYAALGRNGNPAVNGGATLQYVYSGMTLANSTDSIIIKSGDTVIDQIAYGAGYPIAEGKAMSLDPGALSASANDDPANWCFARTAMSGGDLGTPGAANPPCVIPDLEAPVIAHTAITDGQRAGVAVPVNATITDASGVAAATLSWRFTGTGAFTEVALVKGAADDWSAQIPAAGVTVAGVEYYLTAIDGAAAANLAAHPSGAPASTHAFTVTAADTAGPTITHTAIAGPVPADQPVAVNATVSDASGVASVALRYQSHGGTWSELPMVRGAGDAYAASIPAAAVIAPSVAYYLIAVDAAPAGNGSTLPAAGESAPFSFGVETADDEGPSILHAKIADGRPAGVEVTIEASVTDASGVSGVTVYFRAAGAATFDSLALTRGEGSMWSVAIPAAAVTPPGLDYYLEAADASGQQNVSRDPAGAPTELHGFTVVAAGDTTGPTIIHEPVADGVPPGVAVRIEAQVSDASGVAKVDLVYRATEGSFELVPMTLEGDLYVAEIPAELVTAVGVDYYLRAEDLAAAANVSTSPEGAPTTVHHFVAQGSEGADAGHGSDAGSNPIAAEESGCGCSAGASPSVLFGALVALGALRRRRAVR